MSSAIRFVRDFARLGRWQFLAGGVIYHALGAALACYAGAPLYPRALLWGQIAITAAQLMTHYANEYFDLEADRANRTPTYWAGGSRVLPDGELPPPVALITALALAGIALGAGLVLAFALGAGPLTLPLIGLAMGLAWFYSAPPLRLHGRGLGEVTVALIVPGLTPLLGFYLQSGRLALLPLLAVLPVCCQQFAGQIAINFPDAAGDAASGKRTLVTILGGEGAARVLIAALVAAYAALLLLTGAGLPPLAAAAVALSGPVAIWQAWRVGRGAWARPACWDSLSLWGFGLPTASALAELAIFAGLPRFL